LHNAAFNLLHSLTELLSHPVKLKSIKWFRGVHMTGKPRGKILICIYNYNVVLKVHNWQSLFEDEEDKNLSKP